MFFILREDSFFWKMHPCLELMWGFPPEVWAGQVVLCKFSPFSVEVLV